MNSGCRIYIVLLDEDVLILLIQHFTICNNFFCCLHRFKTWLSETKAKIISYLIGTEQSKDLVEEIDCKNIKESVPNEQKQRTGCEETAP